MKGYGSIYYKTRSDQVDVQFWGYKMSTCIHELSIYTKVMKVSINLKQERKDATYFFCLQKTTFDDLRISLNTPSLEGEALYTGKHHNACVN